MLVVRLKNNPKVAVRNRYPFPINYCKTIFHACDTSIRVQIPRLIIYGAVTQSNCQLCSILGLGASEVSVRAST